MLLGEDLPNLSPISRILCSNKPAPLTATRNLGPRQRQAEDCSRDDQMAVISTQGQLILPAELHQQDGVAPGLGNSKSSGSERGSLPSRATGAPMNAGWVKPVVSR